MKKSYRITTVEQAFISTSRDPKILPDVSLLPELDRQPIIDDYCLKVVVEAINQEDNDGKPWVPNYSDMSEPKYEPRFWIAANEENPAGFGFSNSYYVYWNTHSSVGSRLCYKNIDGMWYSIKQFEELYMRVMTRKK